MDESSSLRARADALLAERGEGPGTKRLGTRELRQLVHEFRVHQIELELQNDELQASQRRLEDSRAALADSERRYRELFELAPIGYVCLDRGGAILEANRTLEDLLRAEPGQLTGRRLDDFVMPAHKDAYFLHSQAAARAEAPFPARVALRNLDGEQRDVELTARSGAGDPAYLRVAVLDVSARERAEAGLHESERQRRLLADALPVAVAYVGADGRFEFCNRSFEALHGAPLAAIEGHDIVETFGADVYAALREHLRAALRGEITRFEGLLPFPAAGSRFVSLLLSPDWLPDGGVRGFWVLIDDRSELEEARRGLRRAAAEVALAEDRERRALAADLHDDVGQLISLVSIKLRELQEHAGGRAAAGLLAEVAELTRRARERVSSLTFELSPPLLYDVGFVATAEWLAENLRQRYGLHTTITRHGEEPDLDEATRVTLYRVLRELLINVAKHAGTNRAYVAIKADASSISVAVQDHGFGFDPRVPAHGFGLRNVRERIESLGGRLNIDSTPKRGARITLSVPARARGSR